MTAPMRIGNARILTDDGFHDDLHVHVQGGHIVRIEAGTRPNSPFVDLGGAWLVPGFIDVQVNGGGDVLFNDAPSIEGIARIAAAHRRYGSTGLLPTLISDDLSVMRKAIAAVQKAIQAGVPGVLGIHLEGPYLSPARKGVHRAAHFRDPGSADLELLTALDNGTTLLTLAPERFNDAELRSLQSRGLILSAGHSSADYARMQAAFDAGVTGATHLFNAMTPLQSREPGGVGAALDHPEVYCGLIVDGWHVHPATARIAIAAKAHGRMMLVTDAMPPVGGKSPTFVLDGVRVDCRDGRCTTPDGTLAGSALDMAGAVRNTVHMLGLPLAEACRMASTYPARFLGLDQQRGHIATGYRADFVALDSNLRVTRTWIDGREYTD